MSWKSRAGAKRALCNHTQGGIKEDALGGGPMGCHMFFDDDGLQWWVSVDDQGIAWTWCADFTGTVGALPRTA